MQVPSDGPAAPSPHVKFLLGEALVHEIGCRGSWPHAPLSCLLRQPSNSLAPCVLIPSTRLHLEQYTNRPQLTFMSRACLRDHSSQWLAASLWPFPLQLLRLAAAKWVSCLLCLACVVWMLVPLACRPSTCWVSVGLRRVWPCLCSPRSSWVLGLASACGFCAGCEGGSGVWRTPCCLRRGVGARYVPGGRPTFWIGPCFERCICLAAQSCVFWSWPTSFGSTRPCC